MADPIKRAYRFRCYPTQEQADLLQRTFGCCRYVWNRALAQRTEAYFERQERTTYVQAARWITEWKQAEETAFLGDISNVALQQALRNQERAFIEFFAKRSKYPRFKCRRSGKAAATFSVPAARIKNGELWLPKFVEPLRVQWSRELPSSPSSVTISRDAAGRWHVSFICESAPGLAPKTDATVGIDLGISSLATLSTGEKITNHRHYEQDRKKLRRAQQSLSRKQKGSKNRDKARLRVAKIHARIADRRRDQLHKLTTRLIRENQAIAIEDLNVSGMVKNRSLSRAISGTGWYELRRQLTYKCEWYGRDLQVVSRWLPSTKRCSACGQINNALALKDREWTCECGATHDRDVNAAINIKAAGQFRDDGIRRRRTYGDEKRLSRGAISTDSDEAKTPGLAEVK
jgi:putative transposase